MKTFNYFLKTREGQALTILSRFFLIFYVIGIIVETFYPLGDKVKSLDPTLWFFGQYVIPTIAFYAIITLVYDKFINKEEE